MGIGCVNKQRERGGFIPLACRLTSLQAVHKLLLGAIGTTGTMLNLEMALVVFDQLVCWDDAFSLVCFVHGRGVRACVRMINPPKRYTRFYGTKLTDQFFGRSVSAQRHHR
jgi:hypothetical protein